MAFGIDDALAAAAAGISLTDTVVKTIKSYHKKGTPLDIEQLIEEIRSTALARLDQADHALMLLQRTLREKGVDTSKTLQAVIRSTPMWRPDEKYRLNRIRESFDALSAATYAATDDISALARCRNQTKELGVAVTESADAKHELSRRLLEAQSVDASIEILRTELARHKRALTG
jgi:hypothetical protein